MSESNFTLEQQEGIAILKVARPQVHNALNAECWYEMREILDRLERDSSVKVLIVSGTGEKAFVSGADINYLKTRHGVNALEGLGQSTLKRLSEFPKPTIAAVNGLAFGAGCELALACDIRIASENARFGTPEVGLGILPGAGGTQRLSRIVGLGRAMEMVLTGRPIKAPEALTWGLVTRVVPADELMEEADKIAKRLLQKAPVALQLAKQAVAASTSVGLDQGLMLELLSYSVLTTSQDKAEGVDAFLSKRTPSFNGL